MKKLLLVSLICITGIHCATSQIIGGGVTDIDGNHYGSVKIGDQEWMSENLKATKYNDGSTISNITDATLWGNSTSGAWANYDNDVNNNLIFGKLYNGYVTDNTNPKNVCPLGWHIPVRAEFNDLVSYLGDSNIAGGSLKEAGNTNWLSPSAGTNSTGFTALPGGLRSVPKPTVNYNGIGSGVGFWASDFHSGGLGGYWCLYLSYLNDSALVNFSAVEMGLCVRCMKNQNTAGINSHKLNEDYSIYPNPTNDKLFITEKNINSVEIYNTTGIIVYDSRGKSFSNGIDVSNLPTGLYIVVCNKTKLLKLIVN